jgi:DNA-binding transcriptional LysR family regulator
MQLETLEVFCDVARQRSFSQAAQANGITQSAASQIVSQLEKRMGVQLIDRSTRPLQLTSLGQTYYEGCRCLLQQYMDLEASIRTAHTQIAGTVQVAAIYSVGLSDMGHYVHRFTAQQPNASVHVEYHHPDRVYERVLEGTADLGLVSFPRKSAKLIALPWREEVMVLACAPKHPLAAKHDTITAQDLEGQKYVHFDKNLVIRKQIDRFLREQDVNVEVVLEFDNIENIKQAVALGEGVALLPEATVCREARAGTLASIPLDGARVVRPVGIIHRRRQKLSAAAQSFLSLLRAESNGDTERLGENGSPTGARGLVTRTSQRDRNGTHRAAKRTV